MKVIDLLKLIPADTQEQVQAACTEFNHRLRARLTREFLRLKLEWEEGEQTLRCVAPIQVDEIGYPVALGSVEVPEHQQLAALLSLYAPGIRQLCESAAQMRKCLGHELLREPLGGLFQQAPYVPEQQRVSTESSRRYVDLVLKLAGHAGDTLARALGEVAPGREGDFDLAAFLFSQVDEDVLGSFRFDPKQDWSESDRSLRFARTYKTEVVLYWGVIGLVAVSTGLPVAALTQVVLIHELAHAYTHLGFDRDGQRWYGPHFDRSDAEVVEGLAQYYTAVVTERDPVLRQTYERLLTKQSGPYLAHLPWLKLESPELVATVLARMRRQGVVRYDEFNAELKRSAR